MAIKPITPDKAQKIFDESVEDTIISTFNHLIELYLDHVDLVAKVRQGEVVQALVRKGLSENDIFDNRWLNIEPYFRDAGWSVVYIRDEVTGTTTFIFMIHEDED